MICWRRDMGIGHREERGTGRGVSGRYNMEGVMVCIYYEYNIPTSILSIDRR
jgi:hypothetical protein